MRSQDTDYGYNISKEDFGLSRVIKNRPLQVIVNIITLWSFLFSIVGGDLAWATGTPIELTRVGAIRAGGPGISLDMSNVSVPLRYGDIKETFKGTNGKTIILIQDAHCNYAAQASIEGIIKHLTTTYDNVDLLSLEGGKGNYDLSIFTDIKDLTIREKVSDYFVKEGRVSGPEFFAINNPEKMKLFGIEDEKLYKENLNAYRSSLIYKEEADKHLNTLSTAITNLKLKIYSPELKEIDEKIRGHRDDKVDFKEYIVFLTDKANASGIDTKAYKGVAGLLSILSDEKLINFKEADRERNKLIDKISQKASKNDLEGLVIKSTQFKMGDITSEEFYSYLFKKAEFSDVDFSILPNLVKYSEYVKKYEALDKSAIFKEVKGLEEALINRAAKTEDQKALYSLDNDLGIIKNMLNISLIKDDFDNYSANKDNFKIKRFTDFINVKAPLYGFNFKLNNGIEKLDSYRENMEKFYVYSLKRDDAFIKNIGKKLKDEKKDITVIVTGGFHTGNLSRLFKDNGYSYVEVMPKFEKGEGESPYFRLLAGESSSLEKTIKSAVTYKPGHSTIAIQSLFSEMRIDVNERNMQMLMQGVLANAFSGRNFTAKTPWGYIVFGLAGEGETSNDAVTNFSVPFGYGKVIRADLYVGSQGSRPFNPPFDYDVILADTENMTIAQHDKWIDDLGIAVNKDAKPDELKLTSEQKVGIRDALSSKLGITDEAEIEFVLSQGIVWWKAAMPVLAHRGKSETFLSPQLMNAGLLNYYNLNGYDAVAIALVHELGEKYRYGRAQGLLLDSTKTSDEQRKALAQEVVRECIKEGAAQRGMTLPTSQPSYDLAAESEIHRFTTEIINRIGDASEAWSKNVDEWYVGPDNPEDPYYPFMREVDTLRTFADYREWLEKRIGILEKLAKDEDSRGLDAWRRSRSVNDRALTAFRVLVIEIKAKEEWLASKAPIDTTRGMTLPGSIKNSVVENNIMDVQRQSVYEKWAARAGLDLVSLAKDGIRVLYLQLAGWDSKLTDEEKHEMRLDILKTYGLTTYDGSLDHDRFYNEIILGASNATKVEWLASYEPVAVFIDEIASRITDEELKTMAEDVHDRGYWRAVNEMIHTKTVTGAEHLMLGMLPTMDDAVEAEFKTFLIDPTIYDNRYSKAKGYKIFLGDIKRGENNEGWIAFYDWYISKFGKTLNIEKDKASLMQYLNEMRLDPKDIQVFNANAGKYSDLATDAGNYAQGTEARTKVMRNNQRVAIASSYALINYSLRDRRLRDKDMIKITRMLSQREMNYATAVIWRYTGHYNGEYAYDGKNGGDIEDSAWLAAKTGDDRRKAYLASPEMKRVYQISADYHSAGFDADRYKDQPVWMAVLDKKLEMRGIVNQYERFYLNVLTRMSNETKDAFVAGVIGVREMLDQARATVNTEMEANPERFNRLALISHDLAYWPGRKDAIENANKAELGRLPEFKSDMELNEFLSYLTDEGVKAYNARFSNPKGYKIFVSHLKPDDTLRVKFYERYGGANTDGTYRKSGVIANIGSLNPESQIYNANFGEWKDLLADAPAYGIEKRLEVMRNNQINNIIAARILMGMETFLPGIDRSHILAILYRCTEQGEYGFDGKDRFGNQDPEQWRFGVPVAKANYHDKAFVEEWDKDHEMWSRMLLALADEDGVPAEEAFKNVVIRPITNESEEAFQATFSEVRKKFDEAKKEIQSWPEEKRRSFAAGVHNNGYRVDENKKIQNKNDAFLGSHVEVGADIDAYLDPVAREWWQNRTNPEYINLLKDYRSDQKKKEGVAKKLTDAQTEKVRTALSKGVKDLSLGGYKFTAAMFKDADAAKVYYAKRGKSGSAVEAALRGGVILNENSMQFDKLLEEAVRYGTSADSRIAQIYDNQYNGIAVGIIFGKMLQSDVALTMEEMVYYAAVLWRYYGGAYFDRSGFSWAWQTSADYLMGLDRAERQKDMRIIEVVFDLLGLKLPEGSTELTVDWSVKPENLDVNGLPKDADAENLSFSVGSRIYLKIDGKWYSGTVVDYKGDSLVDGRYNAAAQLGNQHWQVNGFTIDLDHHVYGAFMPPNGIFITSDNLDLERIIDKPSERRIVRMQPAKAVLPADVSVALQAQPREKALRESGLSMDEITLMQNSSKGVMSIDEFMREQPKLLNGYAFGLTRYKNIYETLCNIFGLTKWMDAYDRQYITSEQTEVFLDRMTKETKNGQPVPIVFFVPPGVNSTSASTVTSKEMKWFLEMASSPETSQRLANVYFVCGAYDKVGEDDYNTILSHMALKDRLAVLDRLFRQEMAAYYPAEETARGMTMPGVPTEEAMLEQLRQEIYLMWGELSDRVSYYDSMHYSFNMGERKNLMTAEDIKGYVEKQIEKFRRDADRLTEYWEKRGIENALSTLRKILNEIEQLKRTSGRGMTMPGIPRVSIDQRRPYKALSLEDICLELARITAGMKAADKNTSEAMNAKRVALAKEYLMKRGSEISPRVKTTIVLYLEDTNRTDLQSLVLSGIHTQRTVDDIIRTGGIERGETLSGSLKRMGEGVARREMKRTQADVDGAGEAMQNAGSPIYAEFRPGEDKWARESGYIKTKKASGGIWALTGENSDEEDTIKKWRDNIEATEEPKLNSVLEDITRAAGLDPAGVFISSRTKSVSSSVSKIQKYRKQCKESKDKGEPEKNWNWGINYSVADVVDIIGGRIVVSDLKALESVMKMVESGEGKYGYQILRKENKFLENQHRSDPYRAIQYTIQFGDYTFELQLKTFSAMIASDLYHNTVYKPGVLTSTSKEFAEKILKEDVQDYNWESDYDEMTTYLGSGVAIKPASLSIEEKIEEAVANHDYNEFFDLMTSLVDGVPYIEYKTFEKTAEGKLTDEAKVKHDKLQEWFQQFHGVENEILKGLPLDVILDLCGAAHDAYYVEGVLGDIRSKKSFSLGWEISSEARSMLTEAGRIAYDNRFRNFNGKNNKLTIKDLELDKLYDQDPGKLLKYFRACGKTALPQEAVDKLIAEYKLFELITSSKLDQLYSQDPRKALEFLNSHGYTKLAEKDAEAIFEDYKKNPQGKNKAIVNIYHTTFDNQRRIARDADGTYFKGDAEAQKMWQGKMLQNQLGAVATSVILTEVGGKSNDGKIRDLSAVAVPGTPYTLREMFTFYFFIFAINPSSPFNNTPYAQFVTDENSAWARDIDGKMDRSILATLSLNQLKVLQRRISRESDPAISSKLIQDRAELVRKYILSAVKDRAIAEMLVTHVLQKNYDDIGEVLEALSKDDSTKVAELLGLIVSPAREMDGTTLLSALLNGDRTRSVAELINMTDRMEPVSMGQVGDAISEVEASGSTLFDESYGEEALRKFISERKASNPNMATREKDAISTLIANLKETAEPELRQSLEWLKGECKSIGGTVLSATQKIRSPAAILESGMSVGEVTDILNADIVVDDMISLEIVKSAVEKMFAENILKRENGFLENMIRVAPMGYIRYTIRIGEDNIFTLELKTERGMVASSLYAVDPQKMEGYSLKSLYDEIIQYRNAIESTKKAVDTMDAVRRIRAQLDSGKPAVILGAPGSGKTEQLRIAVGKHKVFDIGYAFPEYWAAREKISKDEAWKKYSTLKTEQSTWISEESQNIINDLSSSAEEVIVFDEFDMSAGAELNEDEIKTAEEAIKIARAVRDSGKKVVLIIHPGGLKTTRIKDALVANDFLSSDEQIITALLQDVPYIEEIASIVGPSVEPGDETNNRPGPTMKDIKLSTSSAGFDAMKQGIGEIQSLRLADAKEEIRNRSGIVAILQDIISDDLKAPTLSQMERNILMRIANSTWKVSQPFRARAGKGIASRIEGNKNFIRWNDLDLPIKMLDMVMIKASAEETIEMMKGAESDNARQEQILESISQDPEFLERAARRMNEGYYTATNTPPEQRYPLYASEDELNGEPGLTMKDAKQGVGAAGIFVVECAIGALQELRLSSTDKDVRARSGLEMILQDILKDEIKDAERELMTIFAVASQDTIRRFVIKAGEDIVSRTAGVEMLAMKMIAEKMLGRIGTEIGLIRTDYLTEEKESELLTLILKEQDKVHDFMESAQGIPAAYLGFLKHMSKIAIGQKPEGVYRFSYDELVAQTEKVVRSTYLVAGNISPRAIVTLLREVAAGTKSLSDKEAIDAKEELLNTGLVGERYGALVMPPLITNVINDIEAIKDIFTDPDAFDSLNEKYGGKIKVVRDRISGTIIVTNMVSAAYPELLQLLRPGQTATVIDAHPEHPMFEVKRNVVSDVGRIEDYTANSVPGNEGVKYLIIDHHYEGALADGSDFIDKTSAVLMIDYILNLMKQGRQGDIDKLSNSTILIDHRDVDIILAGFAARFLSEYKRKLLAADQNIKFESLVTLLKDTAIYHDHNFLPADKARNAAAKQLFAVLTKMEWSDVDYVEMLRVTRLFVDSYLSDTPIDQMDPTVNMYYQKYQAEWNETYRTLRNGFLNGKQADGTGMWVEEVKDAAGDVTGRILVVNLNDDISGAMIAEYLDMDKPVSGNDIDVIVNVVPRENGLKRYKFMLMPKEEGQDRTLFPLLEAMNTRFADQLNGNKFGGRQDRGSVRAGIPVSIETMLEAVSDSIDKLRIPVAISSAIDQAALEPLDRIRAADDVFVTADNVEIVGRALQIRTTESGSKSVFVNISGSLGDNLLDALKGKFEQYSANNVGVIVNEPRHTLYGVIQLAEGNFTSRYFSFSRDGFSLMMADLLDKDPKLAQVIFNRIALDAKVPGKIYKESMTKSIENAKQRAIERIRALNNPVVTVSNVEKVGSALTGDKRGIHVIADLGAADIREGLSKKFWDAVGKYVELYSAGDVTGNVPSHKLYGAIKWSETTEAGDNLVRYFPLSRDGFSLMMADLLGKDPLLAEQVFETIAVSSIGVMTKDELAAARAAAAGASGVETTTALTVTPLVAGSELIQAGRELTAEDVGQSNFTDVIRRDIDAIGDVVNKGISHRVFDGNECYGVVLGAIPTGVTGGQLDTFLTGIRAANESFMNKNGVGNIRLRFGIGKDDAVSILTEILNRGLAQNMVRIAICESLFREIESEQSLLDLAGAKNKEEFRTNLAEKGMLLIVRNDIQNGVTLPLSYGKLALEAMMKLNLADVVNILKKSNIEVATDPSYVSALESWAKIIAVVTNNQAAVAQIMKLNPEEIIKKIFEIALPPIGRIDTNTIISSFKAEVEVLRAL